MKKLITLLLLCAVFGAEAQTNRTLKSMGGPRRINRSDYFYVETNFALPSTRFFQYSNLVAQVWEDNSNKTAEVSAGSLAGATNAAQALATAAGVSANTYTDNSTNRPFLANTLGWMTNLPQQEISVLSFGARGDGVVASYLYATNGSRVIFSSQGLFTAGDVGKIMNLDFAGTNGIQNHTSGISNYISPFYVALSNAVLANVTNKSGWWSSDDTAAIQNALDCAVTNGGGVIRFPNEWGRAYRLYGVHGQLRDVGPWTNHMNAVIYAPTIPYGGAGQKSPVVIFAGSTPQIGGRITLETNEKKGMGSMIWASLPFAPEGVDKASIFQFKANSGITTNTSQNFFPRYLYPFNHLAVYVKDLWIRQSYNNNATLWNAAGTVSGGVAQSILDGGFDQFAFGSVPFPTRSNTVILALPQEFNDNRVICEQVMISYGYDGVMVGENSDFRSTKVFGTHNAFNFNNEGGNEVVMSGVCVAGCSNVFWSDGGQVPIHANLNIQNNSSFDFVDWNLMHDPYYNFNGWIDYFDTSNDYHTKRRSRSVVADPVLFPSKVVVRRSSAAQQAMQETPSLVLNDIAADGFLYGEPGKQTCDPILFENSGSWGALATYPVGVLFTPTNWSRVYHRYIPAEGVWTNKVLVNMTAKIAWTNAGVISVQMGYLRFTSSNSLPLLGNVFNTNTVNGPNVTTLSYQFYPQNFIGAVGVQPLFVTSGSLGPNGLFPGSFSQTNSIVLLHMSYGPKSTTGSYY